MKTIEPVEPGLSKPSSYVASRQIIGLDIIRCLACVLVMTFHLGYWFWAGGRTHVGYGGYAVSYEWTAPFFWFGWVGVEIFFVLSGFVIAYSASSSDPKAFFRSRFLRLVPTAWVCATLTLLVILLCESNVFTFRHAILIWANTLLFHLFGPWIDWSYWTLGIEVSFYIIVFALLLLGRLILMPLIMGLIGVCSAAFWVARATVSIWPDVASGISKLVNAPTIFVDRLHQLLLLNHGCFFAIGVFLWLAVSKGLRPLYLLMLPIFIAGGVAEIVLRTSLGNLVTNSHFSYTTPCFVWILFIALIWSSAKFSSAINLRFGWLAPAARNLGLMTYPLYLLHQVIGYSLLEITHHQIPDGVALATAILFIVLLAYGVSTYLEPAVRRLMSRVLAAALFRPTSSGKVG